MSRPGTRILCVDDESSNLELLESILQTQEYEVVLAKNGREAQDVLRTQNVDLVLLDVIMPEQSGYDVCRWIRGDKRYQNIPVVMVTSLTSKEERIKSIEAGAEDFISRPLDRVELLTRIKMLLNMKSLHDSLDSAKQELQSTNGELIAANIELRRRNDEISGVNGELKRLNELLAHQATTDQLTGISNRHRMDEALTIELARSKRFAIPLSLIMFDIDEFKAINDTFGHPIGDQALCELTALVQRRVRVHDIFARWGGEEFLLMMTNSAMDHAQVFAEKLRGEIDTHAFRSVSHLTCSFGVAELMPEESIDIFCKRVDDAMYAAKLRGRNSVEVAGGLKVQKSTTTVPPTQQGSHTTRPC